MKSFQNWIVKKSRSRESALIGKQEEYKRKIQKEHFMKSRKFSGKSEVNFWIISKKIMKTDEKMRIIRDLLKLWKTDNKQAVAKIMRN